MNKSQHIDVLVIGGGINGCGVARDAAGRGFSVTLAEMADLASGTSCWSTKLIHGGLRYLEHYEFRLVRESLRERERLWASAPHIIAPMRFVLPHDARMRPAWLLRLGLFIYDSLGGRELLPSTRTVDLTLDPAGEALKPGFRKGFEYSDCTVDDARLVVLNARDAAERGATIRTRTKVVAARRAGDAWEVDLRDMRSGQRETVRARLLVNATGPWIDEVLREALASPKPRNVRLVQGSHIVVPAKYADPRAFFFQNDDGRIFFAIPFQDDFTLIGTTDRDYVGDPGAARATEAEIGYLCDAASRYFREPVGPRDVVWSFSGVRPLFDDGASSAQEATRDYVLRTDGGPGEAPVVNVFGGKLTTYRRLAEAVVGKIEERLGRLGPRWTGDAHLPGGDMPVRGLDEAIADFAAERPWLPPPTARRLVMQYGTRAAQVLEGVDGRKAMGRSFGVGLSEPELRYLVQNEWAETAEDVLWRRSKLGLRIRPGEAAALAAYLDNEAVRLAAAE